MTTPQEIQHTAQTAFQHFSHGLATGEWDDFLAMLTDDFRFWFPVGPYQGENVGKAKAAEFFHYVSEKIFPQGLSFSLVGVTSNETTVVFEGQSYGQIFGHPYQNQVAVAFEVRGTQICGYREYLGVFYQLK